MIRGQSRVFSPMKLVATLGAESASFTQGFGTIPGAREAMEVWPTNYAMGRRARDGAFLVFEVWGRVDVRALVDGGAIQATGERLEKTQLYRDELLNMLLVEISFRERRLLHGVLLVDAGGMTSEHAKVLGFLQTVGFAALHH